MVEDTKIRPKETYHPIILAMGVKPLEDYPDWYGIPNIKFIWHNSQSDPTLIYKGKEFSQYFVEDTMWYRFTHDDDDNFIEERGQDFKGFEKYMQENKDEVYELCELVIGGGE